MELKNLANRDLFNFKKGEIPYIYLLDENYERIEKIDGLKTKLFLHQQTIIKAMADLENKTIYVDKNSLNEKDHIKCRTNSGVLAEPVGSGKTIDILGLILLQKTPKLYRNLMSIGSFMWFKKFKYVLKPTLIFVGVSVLNQWAESINRFTNLKTFVVSDYFTLIDLLDKINDFSVNSYDIILAKVGTVSRVPYNFKCDNLNNWTYTLTLSNPNIYSILANISNICWSRVVIDDFDVIKLPQNSEIINSVFTWYVSSTRKRAEYHEYNNSCVTTRELLQTYLGRCHNISTSHFIYNNFAIRNRKEFIASSNMLSSPRYYIHRVPNRNDKIIQAIGNLNIPELNQITEMLNADAIGDAAEKIGIKTKNVIDVFEHILGQQYKTFHQAVKVLHFIEQQTANSHSWKSYSPEYGAYHKEDLLEFKPIEYKYPNIMPFLKKYEESYQVSKSESSKIIERVRSNLKEGECPICMDDLSDEKEDIIIFKCCNAIVCGKCCFGTVFKNKEYNSHCANCRREINIKELVYLNNLDFEYDKLVDQLDEKNIDQIVLEDTNTKDTSNDLNNASSEPQNINKLSVILDILNSEHKGQEAELNIPHLMVGPNPLPFSDKKKILIFGNYDSSLEELREKLNGSNTLRAYNFKLLFLGGTYKRLSQIANEFNNCDKNCILFINSMKHCSGLNLQTATELIFTHRITEKNVQSQVIGRAQRLFRDSTLQIHFIIYENEFPKLHAKLL